MDYWQDTELHHRWYRRTQLGDPNDYVIAVTASSRTGVSGTGKSTILTVLAEDTDTSPGGFDAELKATLDAGDLAYNKLPDIPNLSAVILDEAQGAPGTVGFDRRRGQKQEVIDAINAILNNRDKQLTLIIGAQILQFLDSRLLPIIDSWLLIRREPSHPEGALLTHHALYVNDYDLKNPQIKTPGLEDLEWPRVPHDNPNYKVLEEKKQQAKKKEQSEESDNGKLPKEAQMELAQEYRNMGKSLEWIENNAEAITYSRETVRKNTVADSSNKSQASGD
jgi:hypothetical protein